MKSHKNPPRNVADLLLHLYRRGGSSQASFDDGVVKAARDSGWIEVVTVAADDKTLFLTQGGYSLVRQMSAPTPPTPAVSLPERVTARLHPHSLIEIEGEVRSLAAWCRTTGIPLSTAMRRILSGVPAAEVVKSSRKSEGQSGNGARGKRFQLGDKSLTLYEWAKAVGIGYHTLRKRVLQGMSLEEAIYRPWDRRVSGGSRHVYYTIAGQTLTLKQWCQQFGKPYAAVKMRVHRGMDIESALSMPVRQRGQKALHD